MTELNNNDDDVIQYTLIISSGTVLTGTVLAGSVSLNSTIEIPHLHLQRKVKSLQMFRKPGTV